VGLSSFFSVIAADGGVVGLDRKPPASGSRVTRVTFR